MTEHHHYVKQLSKNLLTYHLNDNAGKIDLARHFTYFMSKKKMMPRLIRIILILILESKYK